MNKDLEQRYLNVIEDNVNVGKRNDGSEFLILVAGIVSICFLVYIFADSISGIFIDNLSAKTQVKIEKTISLGADIIKTDKISPKVKRLEKIKNRIVSLDNSLKGKSKFPIIEIQKDEINAFVYPNGTIFVTSKLLEEINDEEVLAFILAHEIGHYAHRDHLKGISRDIITSAILSVLSAGQNNVSTTVNTISDLTALKYSRKQEREADRYANKAVLRLYGNNNGAVKFFKLLLDEENAPELLYYFSTHPSTRERLQLIQKK